MDKIKQITNRLNTLYPGARIALKFNTPWELLVSVVLSAQCTDKRVNIVTRSLFKKYKNMEDYAKADLNVFAQDIHSVGFYHNKAKNIIKTAGIVLNKFNAQVPDNMEDLLELPGIARKSANIILYNAYNEIAGIAVDTHVRRLSGRLGLSKNDNPEKIEADLMKIIPHPLWGKFSYLLIEHGRAICRARKPLCLQCKINTLCSAYKKFNRAQKSPSFKAGMNAQRLSADVSVADNSGKKLRV